MTIFESTDLGATKVFDKKGLLLEFERQNINLIKNSSGELTRTAESDSWICVVEDDKIVKRAKEHPAFGTEFKIVETIPKDKAKASKVK